MFVIVITCFKYDIIMIKNNILFGNRKLLPHANVITRLYPEIVISYLITCFDAIIPSADIDINSKIKTLPI